MQELQGVSSMRELSHSFAAATASPGGGGAVAGKMREFEIEMERLASKIEHLKSQNEVLSITLGESKNQCESLTVLIGEGAQTRTSINLHSITCVPYQCLLCITGKYESNLIAQQLVAHYADHTIEGLELLSEVRLDQGDDGSMRSDAAGERARAFLLKLEEAMRPDSGLALVHRPEKKATMTTISTIPCPWEDSSGYSQTTG